MLGVGESLHQFRTKKGTVNENKKAISYIVPDYKIFDFVNNGTAVWISKKSNQMLAGLKNKYSGQRCFIIGNGPSLTKEDLELLKNEVTFASNRIFKMFEQTEWRPTYYAVFDDSVAADKDLQSNVNAMPCEGKFLRAQGWLSNRGINNPCYIHSFHSRKYLVTPEFSLDLSKGIFTIATVTYALIQIAYHMGFREIYLLGVDHKYRNEQKKDGTIIVNNTKSYFGDAGNFEKTVVAASWEMEEAYKFAEQYSRENGFRIYNATRGGHLEIFERVDLDSLFQR